MLKLLLKKQIMEFFKSFFYDFKNNKIKSKGQIVKSVILFAVLMLFLAFSFGAIENDVCASFSEVNMVWMYYLLLSLLGLFLGVFGSVFNTFSGLYLSKDNDLLISMPIPVKYIVCSRICGVYLIGLLYSGIITLPTVIIGFVHNGITLLSLLGGIAYIFIISAITLILSCLLGWVVAQLNIKFKNKSYITTIISLVCIGVYYYGYSRMNVLIGIIIENALTVSEKVQGNAYAVYLFGLIAQGNIVAIVVYSAATLVFTALTLFILSKTFLKIATATVGENKVKYVEKKYKTNSLYGALLKKEVARFTSSSTYMVNCGFGIIIIPVIGFAALFKGQAISEALLQMFGNNGMVLFVACATMCLACCGNDIVAPSISLEGKNLWILKSLPVDVKTVLKAKLTLHLILSLASSLIGSALLSVAFAKTAVDAVLLFVVPFVFNLFLACFDLACGLKMPMLNWTNEIYPIKQSASVGVSLFGGWIIAVIVFGGYFLLKNYVSAWIYLSFAAVLFFILGFAVFKWLMNKGTEIFKEL